MLYLEVKYMYVCVSALASYRCIAGEAGSHYSGQEFAVYGCGGDDLSWGHGGDALQSFLLGILVLQRQHGHIKSRQTLTVTGLQVFDMAANSFQQPRQMSIKIFGSWLLLYCVAHGVCSTWVISHHAFITHDSAGHISQSEAADRQQHAVRSHPEQLLF